MTAADRSLPRLRAYQDAILDIMRSADTLLAQAGLRDVAGLARVRWAMIRALTDYQLFKHREIFDPAIAGTVPGNAQRAARMKAACIAIGDDFRAHVTRWSATDVGGRWPEYHSAALAITGRIRAHLAIERIDVELLLAAPASSNVTPPSN